MSNNNNNNESPKTPCNSSTCPSISQFADNNDDILTSQNRSVSKKNSPICNTQMCPNASARQTNYQRMEDDHNSNLLPAAINKISKVGYNNIPEIRVNSELMEEIPQTTSIKPQPQQNQNLRFLTIPERPSNNFSDVTPPNFPIYKDDKLSNQSSKENYSREFRSRIPKRTSTPKLFPSEQEKSNKVILNAKNDSINMLNVVISSVMLLASDKDVPPNYRLCSTKYLQLIRDNLSQSPPNVKKILKLLNPAPIVVAEKQPTIQRGNISCSCPKQPIVQRYK